MQFTKPTIWKTLIGVYVIISLVYMGYTVWSNFKLYYIQQSYTAGQQDTINKLLTQAADKSCQPFSVYSADQQVQLINTDCLQAGDATATSDTKSQE